MRTIALIALLLPACATTHRPMLMKEFTPSLEQGSALSGKKVFVRIADERVDLDTKWEETEPVKPEGYEFKKMSAADRKAWDAELNEIKKTTKEEDWDHLGWVRNGWGSKLSNVYSVNPPTDWLKQVIELELGAQGATIAASESGADLVIAGTLRYLRSDMYMKHWCDIVVDYDIRPRGKSAVKKTLHTSGGFTAWSSSSFEYYTAARDSEQKMMMLLLAEIEAALK